MNVKLYNTKDYENKGDWTLGQNKPNSNPNKPNFQKAKMNVNSFITKDYRKNDDFSVRINKPNFRNGGNERKLNVNKGLQKKRLFSTPKNKPNSNPIKANSKPISEMPKMNVSIYYTIDYSKKPPSGEYKTNPILSGLRCLRRSCRTDQTQSNPILEAMIVNFCAAGYYESKSTFAVRKGRARIIQISISPPPSVLRRESPRQKDKIALKIYPFGIDYPIVLKEMLFTIYRKDYD